jgi:hypothetical protein
MLMPLAMNHQQEMQVELNDFDNNAPTMYDPEADILGSADIMDTRKDKLTLKDLNKLKKLRAFRKLEMLKRQDSLAVIYGQGSGDDDDGGGF